MAVIAFTGSRGGAGDQRPGRRDLGKGRPPIVKRVIAEMGGKNAIIVDDDADLDEAVVGVVKSAFGYQGQKCSACSRAIVLEGVYDQFRRAARRGHSQPEGRPGGRSRHAVGPVIDAEAFERIAKYIEIGRQGGARSAGRGRGRLAERGLLHRPAHLCRRADRQARLAQEEIFGPVLAVIRAADLDEAICNRQRHGLRADRRDFSRSPEHLERATARIAGRQPVFESRRSPALWSAGSRSAASSMSGHRQPRPAASITAAIRRAAHDHRKHHAPRLRAGLWAGGLMAEAQRQSRPFTLWLAAPTAIFTFYGITAAFCTYFCMYAFRKPFSAAKFQGLVFTGSEVELKTVLVASQIIGYALSKFVGIKVCSEVAPGRRARALVALILWAEAALVAFALVPDSLKLVPIFLNGLSLGMVWGMVVGYLEGRRTSELLLVGLSCSFIVASGAVKNVGLELMNGYAVSESWMPAAVGALFLVPFLASVWLLDQIPPATPEDQAVRHDPRDHGPCSPLGLHAAFPLGDAALGHGLPVSHSLSRLSRQFHGRAV